MFLCEAEFDCMDGSSESMWGVNRKGSRSNGSHQTNNQTRIERRRNVGEDREERRKKRMSQGRMNVFGSQHNDNSTRSVAAGGRGKKGGRTLVCM